MFGYPSFALGANWDGHTNPLTGVRWPARHGRLIDVRNDGDGNPKLVWELHRCQDLPLLVLASHLEGDLELATDVVRRSRAWIARHPPGRGIAWANTFEPGLRALSLAIAFDGLRGTGALGEGARHEILRSLWQHARWIAASLSRHSSANNHLLGELVGLLAVGLLAPELKAARAWTAGALREIETQATLQVLPDGFGAEQSFAYWIFVLDLLLVCVALLQVRELSVPPPILAALVRAQRCLGILLQKDEPDPRFGDCDDGRALLLDGSARDGRAIVAAIAAATGATDSAGVTVRGDTTTIILFGERGVLRPEATVPQPPSSAFLPDGGMSVIRCRLGRALFDCGPLGYLSIAAHGHADALAVTLSVGAQDVVVDPGTGSYADPERQRWFRGTAAHATVLIDDQDQSERGGPFFWLRHASARLVSWNPEGPAAIGEQDGYHALPDPVSHRRAITPLGENALLVVDRLEAEGVHRAVQNWPFHPACCCRVRTSGAVEIVLPDGRELLVALASTCAAEVTVDRSGLWSGMLETWEPTYRCFQVASFSGTAHLAALFIDGSSLRGEEPILGLDVARDGALVATARLEGIEQTTRLSFAG